MNSSSRTLRGRVEQGRRWKARRGEEKDEAGKGGEGESKIMLGAQEELNSGRSLAHSKTPSLLGPHLEGERRRGEKRRCEEEEEEGMRRRYLVDGSKLLLYEGHELVE